MATVVSQGRVQRELLQRAARLHFLRWRIGAREIAGRRQWVDVVTNATPATLRDIGRALDRLEALAKRHSRPETNRCEIVYRRADRTDEDRLRLQRLERALRGALGGDDDMAADYFIDDPRILASLEREPVWTERRRAEPLDAQRRIVNQAIADARKAGLEIPTFKLRFIQGEGGRAIFDRTNDQYEMELGVDVLPHRLRETTLHECRHLADYFSGEYATMSRARFEQRALAFAARFA